MRKAGCAKMIREGAVWYMVVQWESPVWIPGSGVPKEIIILDGYTRKLRNTLARLRLMQGWAWQKSPEVVLMSNGYEQRQDNLGIRENADQRDFQIKIFSSTDIMVKGKTKRWIEMYKMLIQVVWSFMRSIVSTSNSERQFVLLLWLGLKYIEKLYQNQSSLVYMLSLAC